LLPLFVFFLVKKGGADLKDCDRRQRIPTQEKVEPAELRHNGFMQAPFVLSPQITEQGLPTKQ